MHPQNVKYDKLTVNVSRMFRNCFIAQDLTAKTRTIFKELFLCGKTAAKNQFFSFPTFYSTPPKLFINFFLLFPCTFLSALQLCSKNCGAEEFAFLAALENEDGTFFSSPVQLSRRKCCKRKNVFDRNFKWAIKVFLVGEKFLNIKHFFLHLFIFRPMQPTTTKCGTNVSALWVWVILCLQ